MDGYKVIKFVLVFFTFILLSRITFKGTEQLLSESVYLASLNLHTFYDFSYQYNQLVLSNNSRIEAASAISVQKRANEYKVLFAKEENKKLPIASLTKLMTVLVVLEEYDLSQKVLISDLAMKEEGEQGALKLGEVLSVKDLLYITLIESSNKAAFALSEVVGPDYFVKLMNSKTRDLGLKNTHFEDSTGLDPRSYSTANDLAKLSLHLFENYPLFREITNTKEFNLYLEDGRLHHQLKNTNELLGQNGIVAGKTGYTHIAKGCFMVIQEKSKDSYIIHIVLGAEDKLLEIKKLVERTNYSYNQL